MKNPSTAEITRAVTNLAIRLGLKEMQRLPKKKYWALLERELKRAT